MTDPHEDLVEAATRAWMDAPSNTDPMRAVIALIAERTKNATPEMRRIWIGATDEIWHTMHRASALWPKEKP